MGSVLIRYLQKNEVMLGGMTCGRDSLCGKNHQNRGHSERSAAWAKAGRHGVEESRGSTADAQSSFFHATGSFTPRRPATFAHTDAAFRMTADFFKQPDEHGFFQGKVAAVFR